MLFFTFMWGGPVTVMSNCPSTDLDLKEDEQLSFFDKCQTNTGVGGQVVQGLDHGVMGSPEPYDVLLSFPK